MTTQIDILIYGIVYIMVSLVMGLLTLFIFFKAFNLVTRGIDDVQEIKNNNVSVALVNSAVVVSVALFISEAAEAAMEAFKNTVFSYASVATLQYQLTIFGIMVVHFALAAVIAFAVLWLAVMIFIRLTRSIDEFAEIKKNNHAVGIFLSAFIISIALIIKPGVGKLLKGIVPFPEVSSSPRVSTLVPMIKEKKCEENSPDVYDI